MNPASSTPAAEKHTAEARYAPILYFSTLTPAASAARGFTPTAMNMRPTVILRVMIHAVVTNANANQTLAGSPRNCACEMVWMVVGTSTGTLPVNERAQPISSALTASVATSGVIATREMSAPLMIPTIPPTQTVNMTARTTELNANPVLAMTMPASETMPMADMSSPRCWMTSVCPVATIARMPANGSMARIEPRVIVPGATMELHTKSRISPTQIHENSSSAGSRVGFAFDFDVEGSRNSDITSA